MRREVWKAVGGFDPGYEDARTAMVDLCLRARQRAFKCVYLEAVRFTCADSDESRNEDKDLKRLRQKWDGYAHLFAENLGEFEAPPMT